MENQDVQIYNWKEHIRKRPGMYIGDLGLSGFQQMLEYLFEELLTDCLANPVFEIEFYEENRVAINIINIDTQKFLQQIDRFDISDCWRDALGIKSLIALSSDISVVVNYLPGVLLLYGKNGDYELAASTSKEKEHSIFIDYTPDKEMFKDFELIYENINCFLRQFAFLNSVLKIISIDKTGEELQRNVFHYPTGIFKQLDYFIAHQPYRKPLLKLNIETKVSEFSYQIGLCYFDMWLDKPFIKTYAGNIETYLGGSLNDGIFDGLVLAIRALAQKENAEIVITRKLAAQQLVLIAVVKGSNLNFLGSVKRKLGMPLVKKEVKKIIFDELTFYFKSNLEISERILNKFRRRG